VVRNTGGSRGDATGFPTTLGIRDSVKASLDEAASVNGTVNPQSGVGAGDGDLVAIAKADLHVHLIGGMRETPEEIERLQQLLAKSARTGRR
jgi:hypothetical protein